MENRPACFPLAFPSVVQDRADHCSVSPRPIELADKDVLPGGQPELARDQGDRLGGPNQTGLEIQGAFGAWIWKLEAIRNAGFDNKNYKAAVGGFEYTYVLETGFEVGALLEYSWDERGRDALTRLQSDVFVATRLTFNDIQSTQVLAGVMIDTGGAGRSYNIEAGRRIGDSWKV